MIDGGARVEAVYTMAARRACMGFRLQVEVVVWVEL